MPVTLPSVAETPGLVSIDAVRSALFGGDGSAVSDNDGLLQEWIDAASAQFEANIGQPVRSESIVRECKGSGTYEQILRYWPVTAVSALTRRIAVGDWETVDTTTYALEGDNRLYRLRSSLGFYRNVPYRVTMTVGYASVPTDIADIVRDAVIMKYLDNPGLFGRDRMGKASEADTAASGEKGVTTSYTRAGFIQAWIATVGRYQKMSGF